MVWTDYGIIFNPAKQKKSWMNSHAYVPTALILKNKIRVFSAFWNDTQVGRIGFIDIDLHKPNHIINHSKSPALDIGPNDQFDEHGVTPLSVIYDGKNYRLYYVGWKRLKNSSHRYALFVGLALSQDATNFKRYQSTPIIGPTKHNIYCRAGCYIINQNNQWHCWYAEYQDLILINGKPVPQYDLCYMSSNDGIHWPNKSTTIFKSDARKIFGYGRSAIWQEYGYWNALFLKRHVDKGYIDFEHAISQNGINWSKPKHQNYSFDTSHTCDLQDSVSCPNIINMQQKKYLFYNGNNFGQDGLRLAIWND